MKELNINKLKTLLNKDNVFWGVKENFNYITNGYFAIKTKQVPLEIKQLLAGLLLKVPDEGECYRYTHGQVLDANVDGIASAFEETENMKDLKFTGLRTVVSFGNAAGVKDCIIFSTDEFYIYIQKQLIDIVDYPYAEVKSKSNIAPVLFKLRNCSVIILPVRDNSGNEYLRKLI